MDFNEKDKEFTSEFLPLNPEENKEENKESEPAKETKEMAEEAKKQGKMLNIGVCNRYQKSVEILREWADAGKFGNRQRFPSAALGNGLRR